jgi:hypothetical protein
VRVSESEVRKPEVESELRSERRRKKRERGEREFERVKQ